MRDAQPQDATHTRRLPCTGALPATRLMSAILNPSVISWVPAGIGCELEREVRLFALQSSLFRSVGPNSPTSQRRVPLIFKQEKGRGSGKEKKE